MSGASLQPSELAPGLLLGAGVEIGEGVLIGGHVVIIGDRASVQARCYLSAGTVIEDDAFIGPGVTLANDNTMDRHAPEMSLEGPLLRRACRVGAGVVVCPAIEIGEEAFVAAGAVVAADVAKRSVVMGVPARAVRQVPDEDLLERWR